MNDKSIENIKGLLKNARDTSVWWKENKQAAEKYAFVGLSLIYTMLISTLLLVLLALIWLTSPASGLIVGLKGVALFAGFGGWRYMWKKLLKKADQHAAKKFEDGYKLCNFYYMNENELEEDKHIVEDVLKTAHSIPLADIQNVYPHLEKLRNVSLPLSWWKQMKSALGSIKIPKDAVWEDKSHEVLEQVYVEMSEKNIDTNAQPRVLKL